MSASPPPMPAAVKAGWWSRNWKWCVPVLAVVLLASFLAFIAGLMTLIFGAMKSSEPYRHAMARTQADAAVVAALGTPIKPGWFVQGSLNSSGAGGEAELAIPLDGGKTDGTLFVVAEKRAGEWHYETLAVNVDGGERIVLEAGNDGPAPP